MDPVLTIEEENTARLARVRAVKMVRERLGFGLRDAKELVDTYLLTLPKDQRPTISRRCPQCGGRGWIEV